MNYLASFVQPLAALQRLIDRLDGKGVIIGGIAASLLGRPRLTADLDVMILASILDLSRILSLFKEGGFEPRMENAEEFASQSRVILLRHTPSGIPVDVSLGVLPFEVETVEHSQVYQVGNLMLRLPMPEDLIILKAVAHRPQDLLDIQWILESHPDLDRERIRSWVQTFAEALEMPELYRDVEGLLTGASW